MNIRLPVVFITIVVLLCGCSSSNRTGSPKEEEFQRLKSMKTASVNEIILLGVKSPVKPGEKGSLIIQGRKGVRYTVTSVYNLSGNTLTTSSSRVAGPDGVAGWEWDVAAGTKPGTYRLLVRGDGRQMTTAYTVVAG